MEPNFLLGSSVQQVLPQIIRDLEEKALKEDNEDEDNEENNEAGFWDTPRFKTADPVDIVREILSNLPIALAKLWLEPEFQHLFHTGYRKMRLEVVASVASARLVVFKMTEAEFGERSGDRKRGPAAEALFEEANYMVAPAPPAPPVAPAEPGDAPAAQNARRPRPPSITSRWGRHFCLTNAGQVVLAGLSAAESANDKASSKARSSQGGIWKLKEVTPSIVAFTSIIVHFVLSGDPEFLPNAPKTDFIQLWDKRMELLEGHYRKARTEYNDMIKLWNKKVFAKYHKPADRSNRIVLGGAEQAFEDELNRREDEGGNN
ncbi:hypothetical protein FRC12_013226 [Ceratobasidium sp. 428]|nr:hypothetical protein FRC12_013226 [Ceratobasidium sp. 428]